MATVTVQAKVRQDGALAISRAAREALGLQAGDQVQISVSKPEAEQEPPPGNPLLDLIGIGKGGPADGAEDHDSALYPRDAA